MEKKSEALKILEESLKELESLKGSVLSGIQKLFRASELVNNEDVKIWCLVQMGETKYTEPLSMLMQLYREKNGVEKNTAKYKAIQKKIAKQYDILNNLGITNKFLITSEELNIKNDHSGGGYQNIGFVEERYADLVRTKKGNDGTYYKSNLNSHINYVRKKAHQFALELYNQLKFSGTVSNCFDILKFAIDDRLLDLNPTLAEQMMLAFKAISSEKEEEWSQSLTTCRRLLENLADNLYPPTKETVNGRSLGQGQYINRLWAFMDQSIESKTNKDLAKSHVDFLGSWLQNTYKLSNKGVHAELDRLEAVKAVFHTYLILADILTYFSQPQKASNELTLETATLDELEAVLDISRVIAKEIVKLRVQQGTISLEDLSQIKGVGKKTLDKIKNVFKL